MTLCCDKTAVLNPTAYRHNLFVDIGHDFRKNTNQSICGDTFRFKLIPKEHRHIIVLSDGLGSGVKASIMASMTATMAIRFAESDRDMVQAAGIMMSVLPICRVRQISYATFSIIDVAANGFTRIVEMGNPECLVMRGHVPLPLCGRSVTAPNWQDRAITVSELMVQPGDRIVVVSDGVTQAGMGSHQWPLGWRESGFRDYVVKTLDQQPSMDAHRLSRYIVNEAAQKDQARIKDDITCGVIGFRLPQRMLVVAGPAFHAEHDAKYAHEVDSFEGCRVVCGGTSANIIARELKRSLHMDMRGTHGDLPPSSHMEGIDLTTEGILTLTRVAEYLEKSQLVQPNPAGQLVELLMRHDVIEFLVGTRINEAHQDPSLPESLDIRRNIVRRISEVLRNKYLKETNIRLI